MSTKLSRMIQGDDINKTTIQCNSPGSGYCCVITVIVFVFCVISLRKAQLRHLNTMSCKGQIYCCV